MNRLAEESSPYLRQHADNPVDWWPWGAEALSEARRRDVPVLLSVGYSACHWCHVMEHESFSDPAVAEVMNAHFVNVKVDREERPDVDALYMRAVQAMAGRGGWPMTVFLTPEGAPFFGGTYWPDAPRHGMPAFRQVLEGVREAWQERREKVEASAEQLRDVLVRSTTGEVPGSPAVEDGIDLEVGVEGSGAGESFEPLLAEATRKLLLRLDTVRGGLGPAPKFPQPVIWEFVLARGHQEGDGRVLGAALHTLREMARGGMRDHLGGAFHRYSVDERWLVPHFEKMLYDNGLLLRLYHDAWQASGDETFARVAEEIADDLLRSFRLEGGAFAAAWDADSEGEEGTFYLWSPTEIDAVLGDEVGPLVRRCWDVTDGGNFEGRSILHPVAPLAELADREGMEVETLAGLLAGARVRLREVRAEREPPLRDEKVLVAWNALAIRGLAEAGATFEEPRWLEAAQAAADHLLEVHRDGGRLLRASMAGRAKIDAFLEDWAGLGNALLTLHECTLDPRWLEEAVGCAEGVLERFHDPRSGLLFDAEADSELLVRPRDLTDAATPSGNALAVELLLRLDRLLDRPAWRRAAEAVLLRERDDVVRFPAGHGRLLLQMLRRATPPVEIAVFGDPGAEDTRALLRTLRDRYLPFRALTGAPSGGGTEGSTAASSPLLEGRGRVDGRATAWVCRDFACEAPVTTPKALAEALRGTRS